MSKDDDMRLSKWSSSTLAPEQTKHACLDAMKSLEICNKISHLPDLSLRLSKVECAEGSLVDVASFHRCVSKTMQRDAIAKVTKHDKHTLHLQLIRESLVSHHKLSLCKC